MQPTRPENNISKCIIIPRGDDSLVQDPKAADARHARKKTPLSVPPAPLHSPPPRSPLLSSLRGS